MRKATTLPPLILLLLLSFAAACRQGLAVPVTRAVLEAPPTALPVATEQPQPAPTAGAPGPYSARLWTGDGAPIHGAPPFDATLVADFYDWPSGLPAPCAELHWSFGDGQTHTMPCVVDPAAAPHDWQIAHRYEAPGIYHAAARMVLQDGATIESEKTQTVLVAPPQPGSLRQTLLRWLGWVLLLTAAGAALIWLAFQQGRRRLWGAILLGLFLITWVPPFSYVPDPLGVVLAATGGYRDDLRLPFANRFLIAGDATRPLRPTLDALIGQTGLDPLDPNHPLQRYDFVKLSKERYHTAVHVRFTYEGGASRTYAIPLRHPDAFLGFYARGWRFDGLGRLRAAHEALPPVTAAGSDGSSPAFGALQRLPGPDPHPANAQSWFGAAANPLSPRLIWSPNGDAYLTAVATDAASALWLVDLQANASRRLVDNAWSYAWTPSGDAVIYSVVEYDTSGATAGPVLHIRSVSPEGDGVRDLLALTPGESAFPGIDSRGLWFVRERALWFLSWSEAADSAVDPAERGRRLAALPGVQAQMRRQALQVRPSPDGERVAYTCDAGLCLMDANGENHAVVAADARFVSLAWRADSQQLAAAFWDYPGGANTVAMLRTFSRQGELNAELPIAPDGTADPPAWLPDGERLLVQTYPYDGRRIILARPAAGTAVDLSRPRWDAFFALHPEGDRLLLSNGRGGFWLARMR